MLKSPIPALIDSVDVGEIKIDLLRHHAEFTGLVMEAKYALVISSNGLRLGAGTRTMWSEETNKALRALLLSMETDISEDVFGAKATTGSSGPVEELPPDDVPTL